MTHRVWLSLPLALTLSCGDGAAPSNATFHFTPPPITLQPGESGVWAQWLTGPRTEDQDVVSLVGMQSMGGHHALLFAMSEDQPVGTTRPWKDSDQLQTRLVGGVGGEGVGSNVQLPDGVVFRVRKGYSLVLQTHYL